MQILRKVFRETNNMKTLKYKLKSKTLCSVKWCGKEATPSSLSQVPTQVPQRRKHENAGQLSITRVRDEFS